MYSRNMKVEKAIKEVSKKENLTLLFVSHDESVVKDLCNRAIYIKDGKIKKDGKVNELYKLYNNDLKKVNK